MENTTENVQRSFHHANIHDEEILPKLLQTRLRILNPVTIFFIPISKIGFCHE
jgi:hypothetical protein